MLRMLPKATRTKFAGRMLPQLYDFRTHFSLVLREPQLTMHRYWDWSERPVPPPEVIELTKVSILMPSGKKEPFSNPLLSYNFKGAQAQFPPPDQPGVPDWSTIPRTVRYPGAQNPVQTLRQYVCNFAHVLVADSSLSPT
jgi:hypothetical protein